MEMDRVISPEERIRRAEEIYYRRRSQGVRVSTTAVNLGKKNKISLRKKMIIQVLICLSIYLIFFALKNYNSLFSQRVINQTKEVLSYDVNFLKLYNQGKEYLKSNINNIVKVRNQTEENNIENNIDSNMDNQTSNQVEDNNGENLVENNQEQTPTEEVQNDVTNQEGIGGGEDISQVNENDGTIKAKVDAENKSQMEQDAEFIKQNYNLIHPVEGAITSRFGAREETEIISAFHQGIDIGASMGTEIKASMDGTVVAASYAGDYGNHIKIQNGDVLTVYAHCSEIEVNIGDQIYQGQEIGKVGATGKVTGPHLHFEIRRDSRYVDPQMILDF